MKNIFDEKDVTDIVNRINQLTDSTRPSWGKMDAAKMMAHCNVAYEMTYEDIHTRPTGIKKFMIKLFAKNIVVGEKPYKKNGRTAPEFLINDNKDFETEKKRLVDYLNKTQELGESHFDGKESFAFGPLTKGEWNNLFSKHLDHHLTQFGV